MMQQSTSPHDSSRMVQKEVPYVDECSSTGATGIHCTGQEVGKASTKREQIVSSGAGAAVLSPRKTLYTVQKQVKKKSKKYQSNVASALHYISSSSLHGALTPQTAKLYQMTTAIAANLKKGSGLNRKESSLAASTSSFQPQLAQNHQSVQRFGGKATGNAASAALIYTVSSQQSQAEAFTSKNTSQNEQLTRKQKHAIP